MTDFLFKEYGMTKQELINSLTDALNSLKEYNKQNNFNDIEKSENIRLIEVLENQTIPIINDILKNNF